VREGTGLGLAITKRLVEQAGEGEGNVLLFPPGAWAPDGLLANHIRYPDNSGASVFGDPLEPSYAQMRPHYLVREFVDRTGSGSAAFVENAEFARHASCKRQLLLDEQHSKPFFLVQL